MGFKSKSCTKRTPRGKSRTHNTFRVSLIVLLLIATTITIILIILRLKGRTLKQTEQTSTKSEIQETTTDSITEKASEDWILTVNSEYNDKYMSEYTIFENLHYIYPSLDNTDLLTRLKSLTTEKSICKITKDTKKFIDPINDRMVNILCGNIKAKKIGHYHYYTLGNYLYLAKICHYMLGTIDSLNQIKEDTDDASKILNFIIMKDIMREIVNIVSAIHTWDYSIYHPITKRLDNKDETDTKWRNLGIIRQMIYNMAFYEITSETEQKMYGIKKEMFDEDDYHLGVWSIQKVKHLKEVVFLQSLYLAYTWFEYDINKEISTNTKFVLFDATFRKKKPEIKEETLQEVVDMIKKLSLQLIERWFNNDGNFDLQNIQKNFVELYENVIKMGEMLNKE